VSASNWRVWRRNDVTPCYKLVETNQVEFFWVVTPCSVKVGYQRLGGQGRWRLQAPPKLWYPTTTLHGVTTQKTPFIRVKTKKEAAEDPEDHDLIFTAVKISNLVIEKKQNLQILCKFVPEMCSNMP
jgi:hypothetical protein